LLFCHTEEAPRVVEKRILHGDLFVSRPLSLWPLKCNTAAHLSQL
jgi:hypothetical protein